MSSSVEVGSGVGWGEAEAAAAAAAAASIWFDGGSPWPPSQTTLSQHWTLSRRCPKTSDHHLVFYLYMNISIIDSEEKKEKEREREKRMMREIDNGGSPCVRRREAVVDLGVWILKMAACTLCYKTASIDGYNWNITKQKLLNSYAIKFQNFIIKC